MNKNGVSAVIGVILMVCITISIAAGVYIYVSQYYNNGVEVIKVGTFLGYYSDNDDYTFVIENDTGVFYLENIIGGIFSEEKVYLQNLINKETTFMFLQNGNGYIYKGAYLCPS